MPKLSDITQRVRRLIASGKETPASLAKKSGLHRNSLYGCMDDGWDPRLSTLLKVEPFLK